MIEPFEILRSEFPKMDIEQQKGLVNSWQKLGARICPLNIHKDDTARAICRIPQCICRKNFWTCWELYYKAKEQK